MILALGLLLALASAATANVGSMFKHRGCCMAPPVDLLRPIDTAIALWSKTPFAVGMLLGGVAWALHVAAISIAPLSLVQLVLAAGVVLIGFVADRFFGVPVGRRQLCGLALTALGLSLLAMSMPTIESENHTFSLLPMAVFEAGLFGLGVLLLVGSPVGLRREHHGIALAVSSGVLFGVGSVAMKALTGFVDHQGAAGLVTPWILVAVAASCGAFYASARSLQLGGAVEVIAVTGAAANISVVAGGILVFEDPLASDALGIALQACAFLLVITASALMPGPRSAVVAPSAV